MPLDMRVFQGRNIDAIGTMKRTFKTYINQDGFTMIEMVLVLIILAIFFATATSSLTTVNTDVPNETEILKSSIRFAQTKALNNAIDNNTWGISFTGGGSSYALVYTENGVTTSPVNLPGECGSNPAACISTPTHNLQSGMTITGSAVNFNKWGSPGASDINIVLNKDGAAVVTVKVTKHTGYILIQ
jgi:prepilin-type N-terminal cleavage/methylation domain-containing protein